MNDGLAIIGHQPDERRVPFVDNLRESCRTGTHQDLPYPIVELLDACKRQVRGMSIYFIRDEPSSETRKKA